MKEDKVRLAFDNKATIRIADKNHAKDEAEEEGVNVESCNDVSGQRQDLAPVKPFLLILFMHNH